MLKWTDQTGTTSGLAVRHAVGDFRGLRATDATADDIVACLRANPEAAGQVLLALESQYIAGEMAKSQARAEQAEHSLAASERALAALRYQAQAGGCELSTVGENSYHCRADALCGLCRLRHRAEQAERELATVTAERDEARAALVGTRGELAEAVSAAIAAESTSEKRLDLWRSSRDENRDLRSRLAKTERVVEAARVLSDSIEAGFASKVRPDIARARLNAALRACDEYSGGSGAATPGGHTSAVTDASPGQVVGAAPRGPDSEPEPAGISHDPPPAEAPRCAACKRYPGPGNAAACADMKGFPFEAPATRAELEALRREVLETVAEERERVIAAFVHAAQHGHDGQVFANRLRKPRG